VGNPAFTITASQRWAGKPGFDAQEWFLDSKKAKDRHDHRYDQRHA
jgi:hypothetical protein